VFRAGWYRCGQGRDQCVSVRCRGKGSRQSFCTLTRLSGVGLRLRCWTGKSYGAWKHGGRLSLYGSDGAGEGINLSFKPLQKVGATIGAAETH